MEFMIGCLFVLAFCSHIRFIFLGLSSDLALFKAVCSCEALLYPGFKKCPMFNPGLKFL